MTATTTLKTSVELTDIGAAEFSDASHQFLMHQENKEKDEMHFNTMLSAAISRAALKDSLFDRVRKSYDGSFYDEELENMDDETKGDQVRRLRAQRVAALKKIDAQKQRKMMERYAAEKDDRSEFRTYNIKRIQKHEESKSESFSEYESFPVNINAEIKAFEDLGCGTCMNFYWIR